MSEPNNDNQYGFTWGQVEVTRLIALDTGHKALQIAVPGGQSIEVHISPKGKRVRVFRNGEELR